MDLKTSREFLREFFQVTAVVAAVIPIIALAIVSLIGAARVIYMLWQGPKYQWIAVLSTLGVIELALLYFWGTGKKQRN